MESLMKLKTLICNELDEIAERGEITKDNLDEVDKLTHSLKSIDTIVAMEGTKHDSESVKKLKAMLASATTEAEKSALRDCISKMEG